MANQFPVSQSIGIPNTDIILFYLALILGVVCLSVAALFIIRAIVQSSSKVEKAFNRKVLLIRVPKERKSEGQGGQVGQDDRLEQIKEEIAITESFFSAIAGLKAQKAFSKWLFGTKDHISLELVVEKQMISFYINTPNTLAQYIEQQMHAQFPDAEIEEKIDYNIFSPKSTAIGAYLTSAQSKVFPFKTYKNLESDPMNSVLNVLAKINQGNDAAAIQFVISSAPKKWRSPGVHLVREVRKGKKFEDVLSGSTSSSKVMSGISSLSKEAMGSTAKPEEQSNYQLSEKETEMLKNIEDKISKGGMNVTVRLLSISDSEVTARQTLDNLINSFSQYNYYRYGNSFKAVIPKKQNKFVDDYIFRSFDETKYVTLSTEEMSSLWHLPLHSTEAPNIRWLSGRKSPPPANLPTEGLNLGYVDYRGSRSEVYLKDADRRRHLYVIGKSGSGKSVTLANLIIQDVKNGAGVGVIDPHGDLVEAVLEHIPKERADDVIIFDPSDLDRPIGLNMLEAKSEDQRDFAVQEMISIFYKLFPPEMIGPMFEHNMRNVMLTLMADIDNPGTVIDIPRMFTDDAYVKTYLDKVTDPVVRAFWEKEMAKTNDFHKSEMLGYLVSKVGRFVGNEMMRNIMGQQKSGFNFREAMDNKKILLVNLAKGKTGEVNAKLLGLIIVAKLQMAAMGRADMNEEDRNDFYLYIDEFQNFITDSISTILSEARKYRLNLVLAHQYMGQLVDDKGSADVRDAVLGNVGTLMIGRIGPDDAEILAKEMAPVFGSYDLLNPPPFSFYTKMLIDGKASKPFAMSAHPPKKGNAEIASAIKQLSRLKFGRRKDIVVHELMERTKLGEAEEQSTTTGSELGPQQ